MFVTILSAGGGIIASAGTGALAKAVFTKVLTSEESQNLMIKVGMYCVTAAAGAAVGMYVSNSIQTVAEMVNASVERAKEKIQSRKESKE